MNADRWNDVVALFERLLDLLATERERFLAEIRDDELRRQIEAMLRIDADTHPLLDATPDELAAAVAFSATPAIEGQRIGPYVLVREDVERYRRRNSSDAAATARNPRTSRGRRWRCTRRFTAPATQRSRMPQPTSPVSFSVRAAWIGSGT